MDLSHSAWSDIFFLGMDFPEGARVLNVSIDLGVHGRHESPRPPVEAYFRVIDEPVLRLTSVDLNATTDIVELRDVFDYAKDYLGLLKAAIIASGIVPPGMEGSGASLSDLLENLVGKGRGIELISNVNDIPKGSRLAVSTNLLACLISVCMRATRQAKSLTGALDENERRLVAARAILGEWLAGSGGGWQDSGGVWQGMKLIQGVIAEAGDPEYGISRGRLLPTHKILDFDDAPEKTRRQLEDSLILVHGGMAQNVGPILEMVTEKYLLRSEAEWQGRQEAINLLDEILVALRDANPATTNATRQLGALTTKNFFGPIQTIIPWANNLFTEKLVERASKKFGEKFWGFWMLGGMSGGGMGFIVAPEIKPQAQEDLLKIMRDTKREMQSALPFAMEPVVYDFAINSRGTFAEMISSDEALMPPGYYAIHAPNLLKRERAELSPQRRVELERFGAAARTRPELRDVTQILFDRLLPQVKRDENKRDKSLSEWMDELGFDRAQHEQIRADMKSGRIGLAQNRLAANVQIEDVDDDDVIDATTSVWGEQSERLRALGRESIRRGEVAVLSLAAGAGSRWTQGAGVVKSLHPFARFAGKYRNFVEVHLAKTQRVARAHGVAIPHIFTTSYLTHEPIVNDIGRITNDDGRTTNDDGRSSSVAGHSPIFEDRVYLSPGKSVGLRMIPMSRDLTFQFEEASQQLLDEQKQKMRESVHRALLGWAHSAGEGSDYTDNLPMQCLHPVGHWFELPNLLRNGVLSQVMSDFPNLKYLMLHNIDTLGADVDATMLGQHIDAGAALTFEVIARHVDDRGGGLARVDGRVRLVEGLAMPNDEAEFGLSYYNSMTTWIDIDKLLDAFGLKRGDLTDELKVASAIRSLGARMPTYITIKDVKKRWGHGQEDIFPVAQFEKLWSDMTALPEIECRFLVVPRLRGQQLKDQAQLDRWLRDGSQKYVEGLCEF
jgi:hypothetical protein